MTYQIPKDPKKIRQHIRYHERELEKDGHKWGVYNDSRGRRHLLGPLYLLSGDLKGAIEHFGWFEKTFPHDIGEPGQYLCWTLVLYRVGEMDASKKKLRETMLGNLYLVPDLLGEEIEELDIRHSTNREEIPYLNLIPPEYFEIWTDEERKWASDLYHSAEFQAMRERYIQIQRYLINEPMGTKRNALVRQLSKLRGW